MNWYLEAWKKYAEFSGRARRMEYWMFTLFNYIIYFVLALSLSAITPKGAIFILAIYTLAILLPSIAVLVRRLHDTGRSAWWLLIALVPVVGGIVLLVFMVLDSDAGENQYGPSPK